MLTSSTISQFKIKSYFVLYKSARFNIVAFSHMWPFEPWNVASQNWDALWVQNTHWILKEKKVRYVNDLVYWLHTEVIFNTLD